MRILAPLQTQQFGEHRQYVRQHLVFFGQLCQHRSTVQHVVICWSIFGRFVANFRQLLQFSLFGSIMNIKPHVISISGKAQSQNQIFVFKNIFELLQKQIHDTLDLIWTEIPHPSACSAREPQSKPSDPLDTQHARP